MIDAVLAILTIILVPFAWFSTALLIWAARRRPRVGALTERVVIAVAIAIMVTTGAGLVLNRLNGYALLPIEIARIVFSVSLIVIGSVPIGWTILWFQGRLGSAIDETARLAEALHQLGVPSETIAAAYERLGTGQ